MKYETLLRKSAGSERIIKPSLFASEELAECSAQARLVFVCLIVFSTKFGLLEDSPVKIHSQLGNSNLPDVINCLDKLMDCGLIERIQVDGINVIRIKNINQWCEIKAPARDHASEAKRRSAKRQALPSWADLKAIKAIYREAKDRIKSGEAVHVDHIVPLTSKNVCGLHVHFNLQIITAAANLKKGNKHGDEDKAEAT